MGGKPFDYQLNLQENIELLDDEGTILDGNDGIGKESGKPLKDGICRNTHLYLINNLLFQNSEGSLNCICISLVIQ
ncbi:MAG: hypothetical protein R2764_04005 [Bacteroidales bacterium]